MTSNCRPKAAHGVVDHRWVRLQGTRNERGFCAHEPALHQPVEHERRDVWILVTRTADRRNSREAVEDLVGCRVRLPALPDLLLEVIRDRKQYVVVRLGERTGVGLELIDIARGRQD